MGAVAGARTGVTIGPGAGVIAPISSVTPGCNKPLPVKQFHGRAGQAALSQTGLNHPCRLAYLRPAQCCYCLLVQSFAAGTWLGIPH